MNKKLEQILLLIKEDRKLFLKISFGVFLFILFFQPFALEHFDFNNRLLIIAGMAIIVFLSMALVKAALIWIIKSESQTFQDPTMLSYLGGFIIMVMDSIALAFYLRYVGNVSITFYTMFKIILISLSTPVVLVISYEIIDLKQQIALLTEQKFNTKKVLQDQKQNYLSESIVFTSDNSTDNLTLHVSDVTLIKSADNYVEIAFMENKLIRKKLIRNTLKNVEQLIKPYPNFVRCHRICIVNTLYVEKLNKKFNNYWITIKGSEEQIPVSRQYLLKLKESI
ncbi:MAG TPA: LytTR family DNA-binding domain-containing protein [Prolixibacteraceae bacterium]|nr:LytTR family DNA-binding domain-containing protein [Prolixibacteraceae bacterium]